MAYAHHHHPVSRNKRIKPDIAEAARHSSYPVGDAYDRPMSQRISAGSLGLSIAVSVIAFIVAACLMLWIF